MRTPLAPPPEEATFLEGWYYQLRDADYHPDSPDPSELAYRALRGLRSDDLEPLAAFLKSGERLPAFIRLELVALIEGGPWYANGRRLKIDKHPNVARKAQGRIDLARKDDKDRIVAAYVAQVGGLEPGEHDAAIADTMTKFGFKSASHVEAIWAKWRHLFEGR